MSRDDVSNKIVRPMLLTYQSHRALTQNEQRVALEAYFLSLRQFDASTLEQAWLTVVAQHRARTWPVPGAFVAAALGIVRERNADRRRTAPPRSIAEEREQRWQQAMRTPFAREAVAKGVAASFKIAVMDDNKSPAEFPLEQEVAAKARNARLAERIRTGQPLFAHDGRNIGIMAPVMRDQALSWHDTMQKAEAKAQAEILAANEPSGAEP